MNDLIRDRLEKRVVRAGICTGCGACVAVAPQGKARMLATEAGVEPEFDRDCVLPALAWEACPGKGVDYPALYRSHFGGVPEDWRVGHIDRLWTGHAADEEVRRTGASGGVTSAVLIHLLESNRIDGAILVRQGIPTPDQASWFIARTPEEVLLCAQSVYVPVSVLDVLPELADGERYAMTCLPEQSAALRVLQHGGDPRARQVEFVLGPYTGTALDRRAVRSLMRANGVADDDPVTSLKWRAGEWPGYLEIVTGSGMVIRSKKVYYNFLIPFFVTQTSLQSMDFANEFADLSVGDAWSPRFERLGQGFSVVASRSPKMTTVLQEMTGAGLLDMEEVEVLEASSMHGHMIDFKKRGGYLRNRWREATFRRAPDIGLDPEPVDLPRVIVELVISSIFAVCRTAPARWVMEHIPERILGPLFNKLRLAWKGASKPAKRKGLRNLTMRTRVPAWRE